MMHQKNQGMGQLLLLLVVHNLLPPVRSIHDMMWNKEEQTFELIASRPNFAFLYNYDNDSREKEIYNFQGKDIRLAYYDIPNIITSNGNRTIKGYLGDIWCILAEYLNFTLKPILTNDRSVGWLMNNDTMFSPGLVRMLQLNQTDIVAGMEAGYNRCIVARCSIPLRRTRMSIYFKPAPQHITTWMVRLFSKDVWFATLLTYILLSIFTYMFRTFEMEMQRQNMATNMLDYFFYNFGTICNQSCDVGATTKSSKILKYSVVIFTLLINMSFNALVISYLSQTVTVMPFRDIPSLMRESKYDVVVVNGSTFHLSYKDTYLPKHAHKKTRKRVFVVETISVLIDRLCSKELLSALLLLEERLAIRNHICELDSIMLPLKIDIVSGITSSFENKRSIDIGLLRLHETGLIRAIHNYWLKETKNKKTNDPEPVVLEQVYLVLFLLLAGMIISVAILIFEQITFRCVK